MRTTQQVTATVLISGPQSTTLDTHGTGEEGSHIRINTGATMVTLLDRDAIRTYAGIWLITSKHIARLPAAEADTARRPRPYVLRTTDSPGLVITARGTDATGWDLDARTGRLTVAIGAVRWIVTDQQAHKSIVDAYDRAARLSALVLPDYRPST